MTVLRGFVVLAVSTISGFIVGGVGGHVCVNVLAPNLLASPMPVTTNPWTVVLASGLFWGALVGTVVFLITWYNSPPEAPAATRTPVDQPTPVRQGDTGVTGHPGGRRA
jgi:hypothetical protein